MRRGMQTGQVLFPLIIEPGIPQIRPWKDLLAMGVQTTWLLPRITLMKAQLAMS